MSCCSAQQGLVGAAAHACHARERPHAWPALLLLLQATPARWRCAPASTPPAPWAAAWSSREACRLPLGAQPSPPPAAALLSAPPSPRTPHCCSYDWHLRPRAYSIEHFALPRGAGGRRGVHPRHAAERGAARRRRQGALLHGFAGLGCAACKGSELVPGRWWLQRELCTKWLLLARSPLPSRQLVTTLSRCCTPPAAETPRRLPEPQVHGQAGAAWPGGALAGAQGPGQRAQGAGPGGGGGGRDCCARGGGKLGVPRVPVSAQ